MTGVIKIFKKEIYKKLIICAFFITAIAQLTIALQFPTYTDDIAHLIINARFFEDGVTRPSLFPDCHNNGLGIKIPMLILPGYITNSIFHGWIDTHFKLRVFSIVKYIVWLLLIYHIRKKIYQDESFSSRLTYLNLPLLGILPLTLTIARTEQTIAIILCSIILISLSSIKNSVLIFSILATLSLWLVFLHPKTLFFYPIISYLSLIHI